LSEALVAIIRARIRDPAESPKFSARIRQLPEWERGLPRG
jgi:hypothetical protein